MTLPLVGLLVGYSDASALTPLVVALRPWCRPHAPDPLLGAPDAFLAADPRALGLDAALDGPGAVAVFVESGSQLPKSLVDRADVFLVRDHTTAEALGTRAIVLPRDTVIASEHPYIPTSVRARWRRRLGLSDRLIVRLGFPDPWPNDAAMIPAALAVCSVAVVRGPWLLTALALGAPVVTDETGAARIGATPNVQVAVAATTATPEAVKTLVASPARATALGWGGRQLIEERHDLGRLAVELLNRLGVGPAGFPDAPLAGLDAELAALGTPDASRVAIRALRRASGIAGTTDWSALTGRRR